MILTIIGLGLSCTAYMIASINKTLIGQSVSAVFAVVGSGLVLIFNKSSHSLSLALVATSAAAYFSLFIKEIKQTTSSPKIRIRGILSIFLMAASFAYLIYASFSSSSSSSSSFSSSILGISWWLGLSGVLSATSMFTETAAAWGALLSISTLFIKPVEVGFAATIPFACARAYFLYKSEITMYTARNDCAAYLLLMILLTGKLPSFLSIISVAGIWIAPYLFLISMQSNADGTKMKTYMDKVIEELVPYPNNARSSFEKQEHRSIRTGSELPPLNPPPPLKKSNSFSSMSSIVGRVRADSVVDIVALNSPRIEVPLN